MARKKVSTNAETMKGVLLRINNPLDRNVLEAMQKITKRSRMRLRGASGNRIAFIHWDKDRKRLEATDGLVLLAYEPAEDTLGELLGDDRYWEYSKQCGCVLMKADWPDVDYLDTQRVLDTSNSLFFKDMKFSRCFQSPYRHVWLVRKAERKFHKCLNPACTAVAESIADEFDMIASDAENPSSPVAFKNEMLGLTFIVMPLVIDEERE